MKVELSKRWEIFIFFTCVSGGGGGYKGLFMSNEIKDEKLGF